MIDIDDLFSKLTSGMQASGLFVSVLQHEPKAAPSSDGITGAVWNATISPIQRSGQDALSMRVQFQVRIFSSMLAEPQDGIDPAIMRAADSFMAYLAKNFTFSGTTRYTDFLGSEGEGLRATTGYVTQDRKVFRVMDIFVPVLINDAYPFS